jgi:hypothetical protein
MDVRKSRDVMAAAAGRPASPPQVPNWRISVREPANRMPPARRRCRSPGALDRRIGPEAGDVLRGPFAQGDPDPLPATATGAGFADVRVHNHCHFESVGDLVRSAIASSPLVAAAGSWPPDTIPNMVADAALADYGADDGLLFPICAYVVTGTASAR